MIPQIQELQNCTDAEKAELCTKGLAVLKEDGELFLSLGAINSLGMKMVESNPLIQIAKFMESSGVPVDRYAEPTEENSKEAANLVYKLHVVMAKAVKSGIPIYQCFNAHMIAITAETGEGTAHDRTDYLGVLENWKKFMLEVAAADTQGGTVQ